MPGRFKGGADISMMNISLFILFLVIILVFVYYVYMWWMKEKDTKKVKDISGNTKQKESFLGLGLDNKGKKLLPYWMYK